MICNRFVEQSTHASANVRIDDRRRSNADKNKNFGSFRIMEIE